MLQFYGMESFALLKLSPQRLSAGFTVMEIFIALGLAAFTLGVGTTLYTNISRDAKSADITQQMDSEHALGIGALSKVLADSTKWQALLSQPSSAAFQSCLKAQGASCLALNDTVLFTMPIVISDFNYNQKFNHLGGQCGVGASCAFERFLELKAKCSLDNACDGIKMQLTTRVVDNKFKVSPRVFESLVSTKALGFKDLEGLCPGNQYVVGVDWQKNQFVCSSLNLALYQNCYSSPNGTDSLCQNQILSESTLNTNALSCPSATLKTGTLDTYYVGALESMIQSSLTATDALCQTTTVQATDWTACNPPPSKLNLGMDVSVQNYNVQFNLEFNLDQSTLTYDADCNAKAAYVLDTGSPEPTCAQSSGVVACTSIPKWDELKPLVFKTTLELVEVSATYTVKMISTEPEWNGDEFVLSNTMTSTAWGASSPIRTLGTLDTSEVILKPEEILAPIPAYYNPTTQYLTGGGAMRALAITSPAATSFKLSHILIPWFNPYACTPPAYRGSPYPLKIKVPVGTYWDSYYELTQPELAWGPRHWFSYLTWGSPAQNFEVINSTGGSYVNYCDGGKIIGNSIGVTGLLYHGIMDNGLMLLSPEANYLIIDAGVGILDPKYHHPGPGISPASTSLNAQQVANMAGSIFNANYPSLLKSGETFVRTLQKPTADTIFPKNSILVSWDDTNDMGVAIDMGDIFSQLQMSNAFYSKTSMSVP